MGELLDKLLHAYLQLLCELAWGFADIFGYTRQRKRLNVVKWCLKRLAPDVQVKVTYDSDLYLLSFGVPEVRLI